MLARIKFRKYGLMKYVGHLDMMRFFQKVLRRAEIPVAYSEGFSPHMIMSFAAPLGVGCTSDSEYIDVTLTCDEYSEEDFVNRCNLYMAEGVEIVRFAPLPDKAPAGMASVDSAAYRIDFRRLPDNRLGDFLNRSEIPVVKKGKKGDRTLDIRPMILSAVWNEEDVNGPSIRIHVAQGSSANLKPELFMQAYYEFLGIPCDSTGYIVHRIDVYDAAGRPLIDDGRPDLPGISKTEA